MAYCSTADVKTYLDITSSDDDALLADLIGRAEEAIDSHCDRIFEASGDTDRSFDAKRDVDGRVLWLGYDLASVNSITNGDGTTVASDEYTTEPRNGTPYYALRLLGSATILWESDSTTGDPEDAITVNGEWAYSADAPADIEHACVRLASYYYRQKDAPVFDTTAMPDQGIIVVPKGVPADVVKLLEPYRRLV